VSCEHADVSRKCPNDTLGETRSENSVGRFLHTPDTGQGTCRVPAHPWHWSGFDSQKTEISASNYFDCRISWDGRLAHHSLRPPNRWKCPSFQDNNDNPQSVLLGQWLNQSTVMFSYAIFKICGCVGFMDIGKLCIQFFSDYGRMSGSGCVSEGTVYGSGEG